MPNTGSTAAICHPESEGAKYDVLDRVDVFLGDVWLIREHCYSSPDKQRNSDNQPYDSFCGHASSLPPPRGRRAAPASIMLLLRFGCALLQLLYSDRMTDQISSSALADIENRIKYHRPDQDAISRIAAMRHAALSWAADVLALVPAGREQAIALTKIEEALMWSNAGIARDPEHFAKDQPDK